jgi:hypothetical protein
MLSDIEFIDKMDRNDNILNDVFKFDPRNLENTNSLTISKYTIALSQYIIYLNCQINKKKVSLIQKKRILEIQVNQSDIKTSTKKDKWRKVIDSDETLLAIESGVYKLEDELTLLDGSINYFIELINSFKRELTRREKEAECNRYERRI